MISITKEELKQIYKNYMEMECHNVDQYLSKVADEKSCNIETIKKHIKRYAESLGNEEYDKYDQRKNEIKLKKFNYIRIVEELLKKVENKEEISFRDYSYKTHLIDMINKYRAIYPKKNHELDILSNMIEEFFNMEQKSDDKTIFTLANEIIASKYIYQIRDILNCKTEGEAITYMRNLQFTQEYFDNIISNFKARYTNSSEYVERLNYLFTKYKEFVHLDEQNNKAIQEIFANQKEQYDYSVQVVNDLIASNCSIEEYCHYNLEFNLDNIEECIKIVCYNKKTRIDELRRGINDRSNHFIYELKNIVNRITTVDGYDYFDYYMDTKLSFKDFDMLTKKYKLSTPVIKSFINSNKKVFIGYKLIKVNKEMELKCSRIIRGRLITPEEKNQIFNFLEENQIPLNNVTYRSALDRYLNGTIDIETKQYTKKI